MWSKVSQYIEKHKLLNASDLYIVALSGGAELVHSVDSSAKAIELTKQNVELNFPGDARHEAFCEDAFKFLEGIGMPKANSQKPIAGYNLIILDPPAFAKHRGALHNALKGYTRLNQKAFEKKNINYLMLVIYILLL